MSENLPQKQPTGQDDFIDMIRDLRPEVLYPELWSEKQQKIMDAQGKGSRKTKTAIFASLPMICAGSRCPLRAVCPLYAQNEAPVGKICPLESAMIKDWTESIMFELAVDPNDLLEVSQVRSLVDQELQYMRASGLLAQEGFVIDEVIGVSPSGQEITKKALSLPIEYQDRILKRMKDLRQQLIATREAKVKAGQISKDQLTEISDVMAQIEEQQRQKERLLREKIGIINVLPSDSEE